MNIFQPPARIVSPILLKASSCSKGYVFAAIIAAATSAFAQVTPSQIRTAYGFSLLSANGVTGTTGAGQTVAIIDSGNASTLPSDLQSFSTMYGLPYTPSNFSFLNLNSTGTATGSVPTAAAGIETYLDVEYVHAIAPQASILLVQVPTLTVSATNNAAQYIVKNTAASVVSMSYGLIDAGGESGEDTFYKSSTVTGGHNVAFVASTGDDGYPSYPALSPNVLAVGGTSLTLKSDGTYSSETVWNNSDGSGGGGVSKGYEIEPAFQKLAVKPAQTTGYRSIPDVAYDSDPETGFPVYDSASNSGTGNSHIAIVGGTSAAAPQWAGLLALADQIRASRGLPLFTTDSGITDSDVNVLYKLYTLYGNATAYSQAFHDITTGATAAYTDPTTGVTYASQAAGMGYDTATGLGTPIANDLVPYLAVPEPSIAGLIALGSVLLVRRKRALMS